MNRELIQYIMQRMAEWLDNRQINWACPHRPVLSDHVSRGDHTEIVQEPLFLLYVRHGRYFFLIILFKML